MSADSAVAGGGRATPETGDWSRSDDVEHGTAASLAALLTPADEQFLPKEALAEIGARYHQEFVGPPLPPKD